MNFYSIARPILFSLRPEIAHTLTLEILKTISPILPSALVQQPVQVMNLSFPNPVGLAAGMDKNGDYIDALGRLGFGFIEVGTVTPRPQPGNSKPRIFRIAKANALINRLGFNNRGVDHLVSRLEKRKYAGILGVNIGKNRETPIGEAKDDYLICLRKVYPYADYISINVSSPNTPGLRELQTVDELTTLLKVLKDENETLAARHQKRVPLAVKISPDLSESQIVEIASVLKATGMDGVIATNTTVARDELSPTLDPLEEGGLSGAPLESSAKRVVGLLRKYLGSSFSIIGVGGVMSAQIAKERLVAGADAVQVYTGLIYRGPTLVREILSALR